MEDKVIAVKKADLKQIVLWAYIDGFLDGKDSKSGKPSKKFYRRAQRLIFDAYWYRR